MKLFLLIIFSCILFSNEIEYYNWAMIEGRYDGKPILSNKIFSVKKSGIYYKVKFDKNKISSIDVIKNGKSIKRYIFNKDEKLYFLEDFIDKNRCSIKYENKKDKKIQIYICNDNKRYKYMFKKFKKAWSLKEIDFYVKNSLIKKRVISYGLCVEYDRKGNILKKIECYPYEETRPVEPINYK